MTEVTYEDTIQQAADQKRDQSVVYVPTFNHLKKAFSIIFGSAGFNGSDFKRLSDFTYFQGGYPSVDTPPKESNLAYQVAQVIKLEKTIEKDNFVKFLKTYGVVGEFEVIPAIDEMYPMTKDDEKDLLKHWQGAGIDSGIPSQRSVALKHMIEKAQHVQKEICEVNDFVKALAETIEEKFGIQPTNFMKAVNLAVVRMKKGDGAMGEKLDKVVDSAENLIKAVEPLIKS